jgi:hypothetical protein
VQFNITFIFSQYTCQQNLSEHRREYSRYDRREQDFSGNFKEHVCSALKIGKLSEPTAIIYLKIGPVYSIIVARAYWKEGNGFGGWQSEG